MIEPSIDGGFMRREELYQHLKDEVKVLITEEIEGAFRDIDRKDFVPGDYHSEAYEDYSLPLGVASSVPKPTAVAFMFELLGVTESDRVLLVASGSGYVTGLLSHIVGSEGYVLGLESEPELLDFSRSNLKKYSFQNYATEETSAVSLDSESFDKVLFLTKPREIPQVYVDALIEGGMLLVPLEEGLTLFRKGGESLEELQSVSGFDFPDSN